MPQEKKNNNIKLILRNNKKIAIHFQLSTFRRSSACANYVFLFLNKKKTST